MAASKGSFNIIVFTATLLAAVLIQIGTNFANDYYDFTKGADNDRRLGPLRVTQAGLVSPSAMKHAMFLVLGGAALLGLFLVWTGGLPILIIGLLSLCLAVFYTGGPFPLAYVGLGDIFVFIFFGPIAVAGTYFLLASEWKAEAMLSGCAPGFLASAILVVNNLRDIETDGACGKKTLAVRLGSRASRVEYTLLIIAAMLMPLVLTVFSFASAWVLLAWFSIVPAIPLIKSVFQEEKKEKLNQTLADTGKLLAIYGLLFSVGWLVP